MDSESQVSSSPHPAKSSDVESPIPTVSGRDTSSSDSPMLSMAAISSWTRNPKLPQSLAPGKQDSQTGNARKSAFAKLASGFSLNLPSKASVPNDNGNSTSATEQSGVFESFTKGLVDSSMSVMKAMQVKARHIVSQNKRRYQEEGFDLDMTYITENIIAMGFPAGDMSSSFFGYVEGFYRNQMEEVIKFFETHHKDKYKVYNLCSERLYDASLFEGKVASFPFDDHNCPPIHLIKLFCQSAYSWLKDDILNVVVVHCKAGKARTGLMICSLLLFLKFFSTAEECIDYYNEKRCVDGKGLILPSQIRYVKYFEHILTHFNGENPPRRRCMLRGFRLHNCPYWIRPSITISNHNGTLFSTKNHPKTKDLMPHDFWIRAAKRKIVVFALPGEPGVTELIGDFKIQFHDRQGDFYCWLNTSMMENRLILDSCELDGFDKRKLPSPGFQIEIVMIDHDSTLPTSYNPDNATVGFDRRSDGTPGATDAVGLSSDQSKVQNRQEDDVFSDSEGEETESHSEKSRTKMEKTANLTSGTEQLSIGTHLNNPIGVKKDGDRAAVIPNLGSGEIKAIAADASVFSFGDDDEDYESD